MAKTAVVVDKEYLKHQPGESHPERPERVKVLLDLADELKDEFRKMEHEVEDAKTKAMLSDDPSLEKPVEPGAANPEPTPEKK